MRIVQIMQLRVSRILLSERLSIAPTGVSSHRLFPVSSKRRGLVLRRAGEDLISPPSEENQDQEVVAEEPKGETIGAQLEWINREALEAESFAQKRVEKDLYSTNWSGDVYIGSRFNLLTVLLAISILVPLGGLVFAYFTYGTLWGVEALY